jgi:hypothetical protein
LSFIDLEIPSVFSLSMTSFDELSSEITIDVKKINAINKMNFISLCFMINNKSQANIAYFV